PSRWVRRPRGGGGGSCPPSDLGGPVVGWSSTVDGGRHRVGPEGAATVSDVRVNPPSVRAYGTSAQEIFGSIRTSLESLVSDAVAVDYYGPNAVQFKTKCGQLAADLANALTQDMTKIADAVKTS